tara:strand:- start:1168 stop:2106 length:939 start_codon:yes stop_codon:yes gene_type:complete
MVALSPIELRKRNNFTLFVNRIKTNGYFTLNESNGQKVQITQKLGYLLNSIEDLEKLKDNRGSILLPTGSTGSSSIRLSQLYKDAAFVTRTQDTTAGERYEITQTRNQLEIIKQRIGFDFVKLRVGRNTYLVTNVENTPGTPKSDMNFIDNQGRRVGFVSLKQGATANAVQQWGGISPRAGSAIASNLEVESFVQKVKELFPDGITPTTTVARKIQNIQLQNLGIYGNAFGGGFGVNNVDVLLQGSVKINTINPTEYQLTGSAMTHKNGDPLPPLYQPALMAIYKGDRNDYGIKNARLVMNAIGGRRITQMI